MTGEIYEKFTNPYINELDDVVLSITNKKKFKKLETNFYIHAQILDIEAIELHKLVMKIENKFLFLRNDFDLRRKEYLINDILN